MKKSRKIKILIILILSIITILLNAQYSFAAVSSSGASSVIDPGTYEPTEEPISSDITDRVGKVINVLQVVGIVIAVVAIMIMGIKYMIGSVEERADYKKTMMPYMVGVLMLVCTITFINIIYKLVNGATTGI